MKFSRSDDDDFMAETPGSTQLGVHISADTAAARGVESANIDNSHGAQTADNRHEAQVKLCSWTGADTSRRPNNAHERHRPPSASRLDSRRLAAIRGRDFGIARHPE